MRPATAIPTASLIESSFRVFRRDMYALWEAYQLIGYYFPVLHSKVKSGQVPLMDYKGLASDYKHRRVMAKDDLYGALSHVTDRHNARWCLTSAVSRFEHFHSGLCRLVYTDFPEKSISTDSIETGDRQVKLANIIIESNSREEILEKLIEEKIRSIFYGNPVDFFRKDKGKLKFGVTYSDTYKQILDEISEIIARRNIIIHNNGRVDRKYLREVVGTTAKSRSTLVSDEEYLRRAFDVLVCVGAMSTSLIQVNLYNKPSLSSAVKEKCNRLKHL